MVRYLRVQAALEESQPDSTRLLRSGQRAKGAGRHGEEGRSVHSVGSMHSSTNPPGLPSARPLAAHAPPSRAQSALLASRSLALSQQMSWHTSALSGGGKL